MGTTFRRSRRLRERLPALLGIGSPYLAAAVTASIFLAWRSFDLPHGPSVTFGVRVANAALATLGSAAGGLLARGTTPDRVTRSLGAGVTGLGGDAVALRGFVDFTHLLRAETVLRYASLPRPRSESHVEPTRTLSAPRRDAGRPRRLRRHVSRLEGAGRRRPNRVLPGGHAAVGGSGDVATHAPRVS